MHSDSYKGRIIKYLDLVENSTNTTKKEKFFVGGNMIATTIRIPRTRTTWVRRLLSLNRIEYSTNWPIAWSAEVK